MVLCKKLWYYAKNYGSIPKTIKLRFTNEKNMVDYQTKETLIYYGEKNSNFPKIFKILNKFIALELTMDKLWYYGEITVLWKNYVL